MKIRVELEKDESLEDADNFLAKANVARNECSGGERYADEYLNELEAYVCSENRRILDSLSQELTEEITRDAH